MDASVNAMLGCQACLQVRPAHTLHRQPDGSQRIQERCSDCGTIWMDATWSIGKQANVNFARSVPPILRTLADAVQSGSSDAYLAVLQMVETINDQVAADALRAFFEAMLAAAAASLTIVR